MAQLDPTRDEAIRLAAIDVSNFASDTRLSAVGLEMATRALPDDTYSHGVKHLATRLCQEMSGLLHQIDELQSAISEREA